MLNVQELMGLGTTKPTVTGAVFEDRNGSGWYEAGEGLSGVQLVFQGSAGQFTINSMTAGGYNAVVPAGSYTVTASGGGMRFPMTVSNVTVGAQNVWLNFIYNPNAVPADAYEGNNSTAAATALSGNDQTLTGGTISQGDIDYYRLVATTSGQLKVDLLFPAANGNLDLRLLDAGGATLVRSNGTTSQETILGSVIAGGTYYVVVESPTNGIGGAYTLQVDVPAAQPAQGLIDSATTSVDDAPLVIDVLANDRDPDGDVSRAQLSIASRGRGTIEIVNSGARQAVRYTAVAGDSGIDRFSYLITDQQGLVSSATTVEVMVLNFTAPLPFQNKTSPPDVNGDGLLTAIDALLVINQLNSRSSGALPTSIASARAIFGFIDVNGNGSLEPLDALLIINGLNSVSVSAEGEAIPVTEEGSVKDSLDTKQTGDGFWPSPAWLDSEDDQSRNRWPRQRPALIELKL